MARIALVVVGAVAAAYLIVIPVLERVVPWRVLRAYWHVVNPTWIRIAGVCPGFGVIETIGRRSGRRHRVPVGGRLSGDTFWLVAGNGRRCAYVRNIEANPSVRLKVRGRWHTGRARICPDDNPRRRLLRINPLNSMFLAIAGTELLTVRIDLVAN